MKFSFLVQERSVKLKLVIAIVIPGSDWTTWFGCHKWQWCAIDRYVYLPWPNCWWLMVSPPGNPQAYLDFPWWNEKKPNQPPFDQEATKTMFRLSALFPCCRFVPRSPTRDCLFWAEAKGYCEAQKKSESILCAEAKGQRYPRNSSVYSSLISFLALIARRSKCLLVKHGPRPWKMCKV